MSFCHAAVILLLLIISISFVCALLRGKRRHGAYAVSLIVLSLAAVYTFSVLVSAVPPLLGALGEYMEAQKAPGISAAPLEEGELYIPPVPLQPDVLGVRGMEFSSPPVLNDINELSAYTLYNLLWERRSFECFINPALAQGEGQGHFLLADACANAMSYYFFSSGSIYDMYTEDRGDEQGIWAKLSLEFTNSDYDNAAKAAAWQFVLENPVPEEGLLDFESEKAYALLIHDYLGKKLSYAPIGYDPLLLSSGDRFSGKQEAYNALCEEDNTAVCAAYARGFALIAQRAGIDCAFIQGNDIGEESHAWNVIFPCDGSEPVIVDVTWDDLPGLDGPEQSEISQAYFYLPLSADTEHQSREGMRNFINYLHYIDGDQRQLNH